MTCNQICANQGKTCADKCGPANAAGAFAFTMSQCSGTAATVLCATLVTGSAKCCCF